MKFSLQTKRPAKQTAAKKTELERTAEDATGISAAAAASFLEAVAGLHELARGPRPRIAMKLKGRILFIDLGDVVAVEAEGNYVLLQRESSSFLLRESISVLAEKLEPHGFVRIHRSVLVSAAFVEEIRPYSTGEYGLQMKGGKEYTVSRKYKGNLLSLAESWIGIRPSFPARERRAHLRAAASGD